jgi:predicted RNA-binding Zn ribbon-like protein
MGGPVCLDFINTLDDRPMPEHKELLATYFDLISFAADATILSEVQLKELISRSTLNPSQGDRALRIAIQMRETMYAVFWAIVKRKQVPSAQLRTLNQYVETAAQHFRLVPGRGHFEWRIDSESAGLEAPLWPIARSAAELLASDQLQYVRACASKTCEWLFLDESKNHARRWCDMTKCGNRAKVKRFYTRNREAAD